LLYIIYQEVVQFWYNTRCITEYYCTRVE